MAIVASTIGPTLTARTHAMHISTSQFSTAYAIRMFKDTKDEMARSLKRRLAGT